MLDVIIAMTNNNGIGFEEKLPWHCREELNIFKQKTNGKILIFGRKTAYSLPPLKNRTIVVLSSKSYCEINDNCDIECNYVFKNLPNALDILNVSNGEIIIAGGAHVYNQIFSDWKSSIRYVHLSVMKGEYKCDTFVDFNPMDWTVNSMTQYDEFTHYVLTPVVSEERMYLSLLKDVFNNGWIKEGRNGNTKSMFGKTLSFDLTKGFPLLTTKKMFFRGVVEELLFFIRGNTDTNLLEEKKINIWKGNTNRDFLDSIGKPKRREGVMGPMYGYQWRNYNAPYNNEKATPEKNGLDQLQTVIDQIKHDPHSRRILLTDFNPLQVHEGVLPPCHSIIIQFYVQNGYLDMFCFNRSSDLFHGLPFNVASSSLLLTLIANITGLIPRKFTLSLGDCHIYESHYDVVEKQLQRIPYKFPTLKINKELKNLNDIENIEFGDFSIVNYNYYPALRTAMVS